MAATSPKQPMLHNVGMSGFEVVAKKILSKLNGVLPKVCGTRIFSDFGVQVIRDKNGRSWRLL